MITLKISGMICSSCERHVRDALLTVPGVSAVQVSYPNGMAEVAGAELDTQILLAAVG